MIVLKVTRRRVRCEYQKHGIEKLKYGALHIRWQCPEEAKALAIWTHGKEQWGTHLCEEHAAMAEQNPNSLIADMCSPEGMPVAVIRGTWHWSTDTSDDSAQDMPES